MKEYSIRKLLVVASVFGFDADPRHPCDESCPPPAEWGTLTLRDLIWAAIGSPSDLCTRCLRWREEEITRRQFMDATQQ